MGTDKGRAIILAVIGAVGIVAYGLEILDGGGLDSTLGGVASVVVAIIAYDLWVTANTDR